MDSKRISCNQIHARTVYSGKQTQITSDYVLSQQMPYILIPNFDHVIPTNVNLTLTYNIVASKVELPGSKN